MPRIAGVTTQKNTKGEITHVTFNLKKHREAITPVMMQLGVIEEDQFEKDWKTGITVEEARQHTHKFLKSLKWPK
jgi:hypothetical protein